MTTSKFAALALTGLLSAVSLSSFAASTGSSTGPTDPVGSPPNPAAQESKDSMGTGMDTNGAPSSTTAGTHAPRATTPIATAVRCPTAKWAQVPLLPRSTRVTTPTSPARQNSQRLNAQERRTPNHFPVKRYA